MTTFMQGQGVEEDKLGGDVHMPAATLMAPPSPGAPVMVPGAALLAQRPPAPPVESAAAFFLPQQPLARRLTAAVLLCGPCSACPRG